MATEEPSDADIWRAISTLEAAGYSVLPALRLVEYSMRQECPVRIRVAAAQNGNRDAAAWLLRKFSDDLKRLPEEIMAPFFSPTMAEYFAKALAEIGKAAEPHKLAAKKLNLVRANKSSAWSARQKRMRAALAAKYIPADIENRNDAVAQVAANGSEEIEGRELRRLVADGNALLVEIDQIKESIAKEQCQGQKPAGVIVLFDR